MLGVTRFVFALFVVVAHLCEGTTFFSHWGAFGVIGFYVVSGFLMTRILQGTYFFAFAPFFWNRFLRLFPAYFVVVAVSLVTFALVPNAPSFHPAWQPQGRWVDWLGNAFMFPFEFYDAAYRIVPPSWSVGVELINYFLLWLLIARNRVTALCAVVVGIAYHVAAVMLGTTWVARYAPSYAAVLPFALGAAVYFFRSPLSRLARKAWETVAVAGLAGFVANLIACGVAGGTSSANLTFFFYANLACLVVLIAVLTGPQAARWPAAGKVLGDLAYPVFLTHWLVAFLVGETLLGGTHRGPLLLAASIVPIIVASYGLAIASQRWIEPWRDRVRGRAHPDVRAQAALAGAPLA